MWRHYNPDRRRRHRYRAHSFKRIGALVEPILRRDKMGRYPKERHHTRATLIKAMRDLFPGVFRLERAPGTYRVNLKTETTRKDLFSLEKKLPDGWFPFDEISVFDLLVLDGKIPDSKFLGQYERQLRTV